MKILKRETNSLNRIKITLQLDNKERNEIDRWCLRHQCGKPVSRNQFTFNTEAEITMFLLRWDK